MFGKKKPVFGAVLFHLIELENSLLTELQFCVCGCEYEWERERRLHILLSRSHTAVRDELVWSPSPPKTHNPTTAFSLIENELATVLTVSRLTVFWFWVVCSGHLYLKELWWIFFLEIYWAIMLAVSLWRLVPWWLWVRQWVRHLRRYLVTF